MTAYVIGVPSTGGVWLWRDEYFETIERAEQELEEMKKNGHDNVKIFLLHSKK